MRLITWSLPPGDAPSGAKLRPLTFSTGVRVEPSEQQIQPEDRRNKAVFT